MGLEKEGLTMALTPKEQAELDAAKATLARLDSGQAVKSMQQGARKVDFIAPDPVRVERNRDQLEALRRGRLRGSVRFRV
jgi:hypothetical protein